MSTVDTTNLEVTNIKAKDGTAAMSIADSTGVVSLTANPVLSGGGITFPATQVASSNANTLDDYEEGTFTPTYFGSTTVGTTTYPVQAGFYTRIGNRVSFQLEIETATTTGTGNIRIGGLPFTLSNATGSVPVFVVSCSYLTFTGQLVASGIRNSTTMAPLSLISNTGETHVAIDAVVGYIRVTGMYFVD